VGNKVAREGEKVGLQLLGLLENHPEEILVDVLAEMDVRNLDQGKAREGPGPARQAKLVFHTSRS